MLGQFNTQPRMGQTDFLSHFVQSTKYLGNGQVQAFVTFIFTKLVQYIGLKGVITVWHVDKIIVQKKLELILDQNT